MPAISPYEPVQLPSKDEHGEPKVPYSSITGMISGEVPTPFIKRRLLPDVASVLAKLVPASFWSALTGGLEGESWPRQALRSLIEVKLGWKPEDLPLLVSAHFIIWLSTLGFLYTCRRFASSQYQSPAWVDSAIAAILGIGLLGGIGLDWNEYPYDLPHAFLFLLTLTGIVLRRWWFWPVFVATAYSKETAVLLILAYTLVRREDMKARRYWLTIGGMSILFAVIRLWIEYRYADAQPGHFWFPSRNAKLLFWGTIRNCWVVSVIAVVCLRIYRMRSDIPGDLRRLLLLVPLMVGLAFFKGWIEERRQYYEVYPIVGLIFLQWASVELGLDRLLVPRQPAPHRQGGEQSPTEATREG
jgi:hypothetical protein